VLHITPWERSALELLATGTTMSGMASRLGISEPEIELRLHSLFTRMGASSATEAVVAASRRGLLPGPNVTRAVPDRGVSQS
jgi:two-component system, NarL family, response regulator YdfI